MQNSAKHNMYPPKMAFFVVVSLFDLEVV